MFSNQDISNLTDGHAQEASHAVQKMPPDKLLNTPTEDVLSALVESHSFTAPTLKREEAYVDGPHDIEIRKMDFGREIRLRGTLLALVVPFDGEAGLFYMNPNRYGHAIRANLHNNNIILTVRGTNLQAQHVNSVLENQLAEVEQMLTLQRAMADHHRSALPQRLRPLIEERKRKLLSDRQMVAALSFPIRSRRDAPKTYVAPVARKRIQTSTVITTAPFVPEPTLEEGVYREILGVVEGMAHVMERSPTTFTTIGEEDLRQHFLVQLNGQFEGTASAETFNYKGKTDILIRDKDRNLFIAECKFWTGPKAFIETIDQLLGYLSWRDTKAAIIIFNRNKDFSAVLQSIREAAEAHSAKKRGPATESESRFRYVFGNPTDPHREIIITVLAFDIPKAM